MQSTYFHRCKSCNSVASKIFLVDGGVDFYCQGHAYNLHLQNPRIQEISSQEHRRMMLLSNEPISIIAEFDNLRQQKHQLQEENRRLYVALGESEEKNRRLDRLLDITTEELFGKILLLRSQEQDVNHNPGLMIDGILCEICKNGDNEAELLLCDSCGRGYHTYCIRLAQNPSHESDPWYCTGCIQDQHESIQNTQKQAENDACVCRNPRRRR